jgi:hypothetical protein
MVTLLQIITDLLGGILIGLSPSNPKWASHMALLLLAVLVVAVSVYLIVRALIAV